jgi:hypothetical protein
MRQQLKDTLLFWLVCAFVGGFAGLLVAALKMKMYIELFCAPR